MPVASIPKHVRERIAERFVRLRRLGFEGYNDYLRSPQWKRVRVRYRASNLPQVCMCGETKVQLHHLTYDRVGEELLTDLRPLCGNCHSTMHVLERRGDISLDLKGLESPERAAAYAEQLAPMVAKAKREFEVERPLWQRLRDVEGKCRHDQLASLKKRLIGVERAVSEKNIRKLPTR